MNRNEPLLSSVGQGLQYLAHHRHILPTPLALYTVIIGGWGWRTPPPSQKQNCRDKVNIIIIDIKIMFTFSTCNPITLLHIPSTSAVDTFSPFHLINDQIIKFLFFPPNHWSIYKLTILSTLSSLYFILLQVVVLCL